MILDPMMATGGTLVATIDLIKASDCEDDQRYLYHGGVTCSRSKAMKKGSATYFHYLSNEKISVVSGLNFGNNL